MTGHLVATGRRKLDQLLGVDASANVVRGARNPTEGASFEMPGAMRRLESEKKSTEGGSEVNQTTAPVPSGGRP